MFCPLNLIDLGNFHMLVQSIVSTSFQIQGVHPRARLLNSFDSNECKAKPFPSFSTVTKVDQLIS